MIDFGAMMSCRAARDARLLLPGPALASDRHVGVDTPAGNAAADTAHPRLWGIAIGFALATAVALILS
jgi:hypothetical protein